MMKRISPCYWLLVISFMTCRVSTANAAEPVRLIINSGATSMPLKLAVEKNVSMLMNEINRAYEQDLSSLKLPEAQVTDEAQRGLNMLWNNEHFQCTEEEIVERLLSTRDGFQVRGIPLSVKAVGSDSLTYQEAIINFDVKGVIVSVHYTANDLSTTVVKEWLTNSRNEVSDIDERMMILDYVEHFRTAYNQKDLKFLRQVFSTDALIITGRVIKVRKTELEPNGIRIVYNKQNKEQYLNNLRNAFNNNRYIKVSFDDVTIAKHPDPKKEGIYGVTVHQRWNSSNYSDEGYVFMVWDFRNSDEPQIHVRTWQPEFMDKGVRLDTRNVFTLGDFDL